MRNEELLDHADDDKAKRFKNRIEEFEDEIEDLSGGDLEEALHLEKRMESTVNNVDEIITTLQEHVSSLEGRAEDIEDDFSPGNNEDIDGLEDLESVSIGGYHFSIKEIKQRYKNLHEDYDRRIQEWKTYQQEILDLKAAMLKQVVEDIHGDSIEKEAAQRILELSEKKYEEAKEVQEERLDDAKQVLENKVESKVTREMSDERERIARTEARMEFIQELLQERSELFNDLIILLQGLAENGSDEVEHIQDRAQKLQQKAEDPVSHAQDTVEEKLDGLDERPQEPEKQEDQDAGPQYEFKGKALSELKEEFEKVAAHEDPQNHSFNYIAEKSDCSNAAISKKIDKVREEYDDDPIPNLGKDDKAAS